MLKLIAAILMATLLLFPAGCGTAKPSESAPESSESTQIPNPINTVESAADFEPLGVKLEAPEGAENIIYSIINSEIAQIIYDLDGRVYTLRGAKKQEDISGIYEPFDEKGEGVQIDGDNWSASVDIRTIERGKAGMVATWFNGDIQYSLYTGDSIDLTTFSDAVTTLATYTNS